MVVVSLWWWNFVVDVLQIEVFRDKRSLQTGRTSQQKFSLMGILEYNSSRFTELLLQNFTSWRCSEIKKNSAKYRFYQITCIRLHKATLALSTALLEKFLSKKLFPLRTCIKLVQVTSKWLNLNFVVYNPELHYLGKLSKSILGMH